MKKNDVKLIGICGPARSGKDTVGQLISKVIVDTRNDTLQDHVIATESFAAPIKSMIAMLLDFFGYGSIMNPPQLAPYLDGDKKEEVLDKIGVSTRKLMQTLGTEWGRDMIADDLWLNCMEERIHHYAEAVKHGHKGAFVIVTDLRFDNEAEMIKRNGGTILQVTTTRPLPDVQEHETERGISDCLVDARITNDKDLEHLEYLVVAYLEGLLEVGAIGDDAPHIIHIPEVPDAKED